MLEMNQIADIARAAGRRHFGARAVKDVMTEPDSDFDGNDIVRITFVLGAATVRRLNGDNILNALTEMRQRLSQQGDERFARVRYATPADLVEDANSEP